MRQKVLRALRSKTASDSAWALGDQAFAFLGTAISAYLLTKRLGDVGYGAFSAVYGLIGPGLAFIQSGVMLAILDRIVREKESPQHVASVFLGYVWTVGVLLGTLFILYATRFIEGMPVAAAIAFIATEFAVTAGMWATTAVVQAARGYRFASQVRLMISALRIVVLITLAAFGRLTLTWLALTQMAVFLVASLLIMDWHQKLCGVPLRAGRYGRRDVASTSMYAVGLSAVGVQTHYDQVILQGRYEADAGRYAAAFKFVMLGLMPLNAIAAATHMDFLSVDDDHNDQMRKAKRFAALGVAYSAVFVGVVWVAAPLVPRVLGSDFDGTVTMMRLLVPLVPLRGIGMFPMNGLLGLGRNVLRTKILVGNAAFSLALYLALIPGYSWKGAIAGTLISEVTLFVVSWVALFRCQASHDRDKTLEPVA